MIVAPDWVELALELPEPDTSPLAPTAGLQSLLREIVHCKLAMPVPDSQRAQRRCAVALGSDSEAAWRVERVDSRKVLVDAFVRLEMLHQGGHPDYELQLAWDELAGVLGFRVLPDRPPKLAEWVRLSTGLKGLPQPLVVTYGSTMVGLGVGVLRVCPLGGPALRDGRWVVDVLDLDLVAQDARVTERTLLIDRVMEIVIAPDAHVDPQRRDDFHQAQIQIPRDHPWRPHLVSAWKGQLVPHAQDCGCSEEKETHERLSLSVKPPFAENVAMLLLRLGPECAYVEQPKPQWGEDPNEQVARAHAALCRLISDVYASSE